MKKIILYSIILLTISCKQSSEKQNQENLQGQIETIRSFYMKFYSSESNSADYGLMSKYVSERILKGIDSLSSENNLILDYDPFIQGQDWDAKQLIQSLKIDPLKKRMYFESVFISLIKNSLNVLPILIYY